MNLEDTLTRSFRSGLDVVDLPAGDPADARRTGARMRVRRRVLAGAAAVAVLAVGVAGSLAGTRDHADGPAAPRGLWREIPAPPLSPRALALGVWTGRDVIYLGGERRPCSPGVSCDAAMTNAQAARAYGWLEDGAAYDVASGTWRRIAPAPDYVESGSEAAFAAGHLFVDTNRGWYAYDVRRDRWSDFSTRWLQGYAVSAVNDLVYGQTAAGKVAAYDARSGRWTTYPEDTIRPRLGGATVSGTPSGPVLGGYDASTPYNIHHGSPTLVDVWDGQAWRRLPQTGQMERGFVWTGRRLVNPSVGEQDRGDEFTWDRAYPYGGTLDPAAGTWQPLPPALEQAAVGWDVSTTGYPAAPGGGWFVEGGRVYDDDTGRAWPLPRPEGAPRVYSSAVWADGRVVAFGGASYSGQRLLSASNHAWIYTP
jgi:hypothetical protein